MQFIPGTKFINRTKSNTKLFTYNKIYILQDVKILPDNEYVTYVFNVDGNLKEINFKSIKEADDWLTTIIF